MLCEDFNILKYSIWQECMSTSGCLGLLKGHTHGEVWEACLWGVSCSLGPCSLGPPATGGVAKRRFVGFGHSILGMYVCNQIVYSLAQSLVSMCCDPARQSAHSTNSICFHLFLITITVWLDLCYYLTNARLVCRGQHRHLRVDRGMDGWTTTWYARVTGLASSRETLETLKCCLPV